MQSARLNVVNKFGFYTQITSLDYFLYLSLTILYHKINTAVTVK
jgi:hypothetical protein